MQSVAEYAFAEPAELVRHREAATRLHGAVARAVHDVFARHGTSAVPPDGAFYVYPDFSGHRERLRRSGIRTDIDLTTHLLADRGLAVLAGSEFGDRPEGLRFRAATSLLYGSTAAQRTAAIEASDPLTVPHVRAALDRLDDVVGGVVSC